LAPQISPPFANWRRLLYCGEWIESHALHIYLLHAPDFLGYEDVIQMAKDHPDGRAAWVAPEEKSATKS